VRLFATATSITRIAASVKKKRVAVKAKLKWYQEKSAEWAHPLCAFVNHPCPIDCF